MRKMKGGLEFVWDDHIIFLHNNGDVRVRAPKAPPDDLLASKDCLSLAELIHGIRIQGYESKLLIPALNGSRTVSQFRGQIYKALPGLKDLKDTSMWVNGRWVETPSSQLGAIQIME